MAERPQGATLIQQFEFGLDAPICLTWELTYACNLSCAHCLSSSGKRDPRELTTAQAEAVIDELQRAKPAAAKGRYMKKISISSTMGPGVKIDANRLRPEQTV